MGRVIRVRMLAAALVIALLLTACGQAAEAPLSTAETGGTEVTTDTAQPTVGQTPTPAPDPATDQATPPVTDLPTATPEPTAATTPTATATPWPENWQDVPVVPAVSETARQIYARGIELGRDPHSFSIIGDCQSIPEFFLGGFEDPAQYNLADYAYLQAVIDHYAVSHSFTRLRFTANPGFNVASVLSPLWNTYDQCDRHESPLECELRVNNPSVAIITMETWWYDRPAETYAGYLRQIVQYLIDNGVVPIIGTKADNLEGDWSINAAMVQVAREYDLPVWNFWAAVQHLPGHGLRVDEGDYFHLTYSGPWFHFYQLDAAWTVRNLTALQTLDAVWRGLNGLPPADTAVGSS